MADWKAKEFAEFIMKQTFREASTAPRNPHSYIVKSKTVNGTDEDFDAAAEFIERYGFKVEFWNREYTVFHMGAHFYWVMGGILNRNDLWNYDVVVYPKTQRTRK